MSDTSIILPRGYRIARFDDIDSTNSEALRRATSGEAGGLWIMAGRQMKGRGRSGRTWHSGSGNFYSSLLIQLSSSANDLSHLPLTVGVAAHEALLKACEDIPPPSLRLKWPNDILLNRAKIGGVLIESLHPVDLKGAYVIIGIGLNLVEHPHGIASGVTNLAVHGYVTSPAAVLEAMAATMDCWLNRWDEGDGNEGVRAAWLSRALGVGDDVSVKLSEEVVMGAFEGLDERGALMLRLADGEIRRISFGDVLLQG